MSEVTYEDAKKMAEIMEAAAITPIVVWTSEEWLLRTGLTLEELEGKFNDDQAHD